MGRDSRAPWLDKYGPPTRTDYRVVVENLSTRVSWQVRCDLGHSFCEMMIAQFEKRHLLLDIESLRYGISLSLRKIHPFKRFLVEHTYSLYWVYPFCPVFQ